MAYCKSLLLITVILFQLSCNNIKRKGDAAINKTKQAVSQTKQTISDKKNQLVDKVFRPYDHDKADSEHNKQRFKDHLQVELTGDVKNIYAYGDFLGADYKVLIAFSCDQNTINKIIAAKKMQLTTTKHDDGLNTLEEFKWWNKNTIELLEPYKAGKEYEYWEYLWYDPKLKQAYYQEFSL